jgi:hypothetical protein
MLQFRAPALLLRMRPLPASPMFPLFILLSLTMLGSVLGDWPPLHKAACVPHVPSRYFCNILHRYEGDVSAAQALVSAGALLNQKDSKCARALCACSHA